ncbi:MAG TPA: prephenate dehydratase domain-containing protein [Candidatus Saccharimonadia bacterium]
MTTSKSDPKPIKVAISGIAGSFSEEAAGKFLRDAELDGAKVIYATTARNTFDAVAKGHVEYGLVPLENSNGGIVIETVYAAADYLYKIERILEIDVHQNLIVLPGTKRQDITQIVSHHQGLAQCKFYLRRDWPAIEHVEYADTALAAHDLAKGKLPKTAAAIASAAAAKLYDLEILEPSIQDLKFNFTSFMVITQHD